MPVMLLQSGYKGMLKKTVASSMNCIYPNVYSIIITYKQTQAHTQL